MADATGRYTVYSVGHYRQRLDDLMFTLHFMDYTGTGFFNHPLIVIFAIATSLLTLSGGYLLISRSGPTGQQQAWHPSPSECGGAGTCGKCRVQCTPNTPVTDVEQHHLNQQQLAHGIRLGCQQQVGACQQVELPPTLSLPSTLRWPVRQNATLANPLFSLSLLKSGEHRPK